MTGVDKQAQEERSRGNEYFRNKQYKEACECYTVALSKELSTEDRAACFANRAAAKLKLEDYEGALEDCSEALSLDENYWKAKYRRKECYLKLGRYEEALKDAKALV
jgi:DnaJ family protein C protein 7